MKDLILNIFNVTTPINTEYWRQLVTGEYLTGMITELEYEFLIGLIAIVE